jgi:hypothetical protein
LNLDQAANEALRLSHLIDAGIEALREQSTKLADAESAYRKAKAEAWLRCPNDDAGVKAGEREWTAARREAWVNAHTADARRERDIADGMRQAALEAVRARRTQVSAIQSLLAAEREEAAFARTGPNAA